MNVPRRAVILLVVGLAAAWGALVVYGPSCPLCIPKEKTSALATTPADLNAPNPLPLSGTLELEKMTWMEVRDRVKGGFTRVIVPTGGIEQNGPSVALNKHDLIVKAVSVRAAELLGNTIVAPVVSFVPEGGFHPPTGHMRYPGTISLSSDTFQRLLQDIITSLSLSGFQEIIVVGDSGDSQDDIVRVVTQRNPGNTNNARVRYLTQFYNYDGVRELLRERGITETPENFHEELAFSLQLMAIDPGSIRYDQRIAAGMKSLGGVSLQDREKVLSLGREILEWRAGRVADAVRAQ
jgi:creatinine amidohydrolase